MWINNFNHQSKIYISTAPREPYSDQYRSRTNTEARGDEASDQSRYHESYPELPRNRRNTINTPARPAVREDNNTNPSQETTVAFLAKCLEGVQQNLAKQLSENMNSFCQKMINQQNQMNLYNPYQPAPQISQKQEALKFQVPQVPQLYTLNPQT